MRHASGAWILAALLGCSHGAWSTSPAGSRTLAHSSDGSTRGADAYDTRARGGLLLGDSDEGVERALKRACENAGLEADGRLAELALTVVRESGHGQNPPHGSFVAHHAQRLGLLEPTPQLWLASAPHPEQLVASLEQAVREAAKTSRLTHCGGALVRSPRGVALALALSGRFLELGQPVPRRVAEGSELALSATLAKGYRAPSLALTTPDGRVQRLSLRKGSKVSHRLQFDTPGEHTLELLARGPQGMSVLAVFPVLVGDAPERAAPAYDEGPGEADPAALVRRLAELIQAERKRHGLPPLAQDPRLDQVALAHSTDMLEHNFVAHTSKRTGEAQDRVSRAGLRASVLLENIGRGYSAEEIHRGLMESPGHRGNILHPEAKHLGLGAVAVPEGARTAFLVTQVMARLTEARSVESEKSALLDALEARRKLRKLGRVALDQTLSREAQQAAERYARGEVRDQRLLLNETTGRVRKAPAGVLRLGATLALTEEAEPLADEAPLLDPKLRALGVGMAPLDANASHRYVVVLLLGTGS